MSVEWFCSCYKNTRALFSRERGNTGPPRIRAKGAIYLSTLELAIRLCHFIDPIATLINMRLGRGNERVKTHVLGVYKSKDGDESFAGLSDGGKRIQRRPGMC